MPTALVFSAGGLYAAWEVGVWKALCAADGAWASPDIVVGASAGAWNGWCIAGGATPDELAREWLDPRTAGLIQLGLHRSGILRAEPLHQEARSLFGRYQPRIPFGLTLVQLPRLRVRLVQNQEITWRHLAAAASIPLGFPPVEIRGMRYVDGGLAGALPLWAAEEMGATRAVAVNCLTRFPFNLRKVLPLRQPSANLKVIAIEPSQTLGSLRDALHWSQANIKRWLALGEQDGYRAITSITM